MFLDSTWKTFEAPRQVEILTKPKSLRHLTPFIGRERTVKEAAAVLGVTQHAMLYWVEKLVELDMLELVRSEPRAGKPIKHYQACAEHFVVPLNAVSAETFEALLAQYDAAWEALFRKNLVETAQDAFERLHTWSLVVSKGEGESARVDVTPEAGHDGFISARLLEPASPAVLTCWVPLGLSFEDAKTFQKELLALLRRYQARPGAQPYLARIALTPMTKD